MLGSAMFRVLSEQKGWQVYGTARAASVRAYFDGEQGAQILTGVDVENHDSLVAVLEKVRPDAVINCIGLVKQFAEAEDPLLALPINAMLPHRLAGLCALASARLVHVSTDCVFNGKRGDYRESDVSDAEDLYGKSKYIGEVTAPHTITLRTSIIGHELNSAHGLVGWMLAQEGRIKGYRKAVFSGLPTVELSRIVRDIVLPADGLSGLYHVAAAPIAKFDLLNLVAAAYGKPLTIEPDDAVVIDRSLNADRFREATGYVAPAWPELVEKMKEFR